MPKDVDELINGRSTEVLPMSSPVGPIRTRVHFEHHNYHWRNKIQDNIGLLCTKTSYFLSVSAIAIIKYWLHHFATRSQAVARIVDRIA